MEGVSLITPTGDRPVAFRFCEEYIARQTWVQNGNPLQWIVVDDGTVPTECTCGQDYVRRKPDGGPRSLHRNLIAGLRRAAYDRILIIEDDDWYAPEYIAHMAGLLETWELVGESRAKYYHVEHRRYRTFGNWRHASLCQTGFRQHLAALVEECCEPVSPFIDMRIWAFDLEKFLEPQSRMVVGIKGMPGRAGIGSGHRNVHRGRYHTDGDGSVLRSWIGADATRYFDLFPQEVAQSL